MENNESKLFDMFMQEQKEIKSIKSQLEMLQNTLAQAQSIAETLFPEEYDKFKKRQEEDGNNGNGD